MNLCAPNELAQVTVTEATKMKQSTQDWCNCEKCKKMSTSLKCMCCYDIPNVKAFQLKRKARLTWNTAVLRFFAEYVGSNQRKKILGGMLHRHSIHKVKLTPGQNLTLGQNFFGLHIRFKLELNTINFPPGAKEENIF